MKRLSREQKSCLDLCHSENEDFIKLGLQLNESNKLGLFEDWAEICQISGKTVFEILTGYLYLRGTNITTLPEGLSVGGYLDLRGLNITTLPEGLSVGGYLYLEGTNITTLPESLSVGGDIFK